MKPDDIHRAKRLLDEVKSLSLAKALAHGGSSHLVCERTRDASYKDSQTILLTCDMAAEIIQTLLDRKTTELKELGVEMS